MGSSASKIKLSPVAELLGYDDDNSDSSEFERVKQIHISNLVAFKNHPFKVLDDEKMEETKESIGKYGVLVPIIARPKEDGTYEIIAGHRRVHASSLLGNETIPTLIRDLDDEESTIIMVDSNIQRENLLFSEKAFAFKMKLEAIKRQAGRPKNNSTQVGQNFVKGKTSVEVVAEEAGESRNQIQRYIRLTELNSTLLDMVDDKKIPFNTCVELSYLTDEEQEILLSTIQELNVIPSMGQATKLKKYSKEKSLTTDMIDVIFSENTQKSIQVTLKANKLSKYFSEDTSKEKIEEIIEKALEEYLGKHNVST